MEELEQPAPQDSAPQPQATEANSEPELDEGLLEEQQPDDEAEEELEGLKIRGKKDLIEKLKSERLMQADYTRKTQAVAEEKRVNEQIRQLLTVQARVTQEVAEDLAELKAVDRQLQQYKGVDWQALMDSDPATAQKLDFQHRKLQEQRSQVAQGIAAKQQMAADQHQASLAPLVQRAEAYLSREVKGWSAERSNALAEYAVKEGFPREALLNVTAHMPAFGKVLHKAEMYDRLVERQKATRPQAQAQEKPATTISAQKAPANRDPEKMSPEEWVKWRNASLKRK